MRKTNVTGLFIFLLCCLVGLDLYGQTSPEDWSSLTEDNYTIRYPAEWTLDESQQMGTSFILFSPLSSAEDQFKENVNLIVQDLSAYDMDLDQYVELSKDQVKTMIAEANILASERVQRDGSEFQKMLYTGTQGTFDLKFEQYYWIKDKKAYVLTLTTEVDQFDAFQPAGEKILDSFRIE